MEIWTNWMIDGAGRYELWRGFVTACALDGQSVELAAETTAGGGWLRLAFDPETVGFARSGLLAWKRGQ